MPLEIVGRSLNASMGYENSEQQGPFILPELPNEL